MSRSYYRRSAPKVQDGKVQRKHRHAPTPNYWNTPQDAPVIDRERPGQGYRHFLRKADVERFIALLPDWDTLSQGLDAIVLAAGEWSTQGWHDDGVIGICAWEREQSITVHRWFFDEHADLLRRLHVPYEFRKGVVHLRFTAPSIRAFQLLHVFLHELGHHHDQMTTRSRREPARGEGYAEAYALRYERLIWDRYFAAFESP